MTPRRRRMTELDELAENERAEVVRSAGRVVRKGRVQGPDDIYPDIKRPSALGFTRQGVPLLPMALLYERLVVYVPPSNRRALQARWRLTYEDFLKLVESDLVQPLVGHIHDYTAPHFDPLFDGGAVVPSVWTRGVTLLATLGLEDTLKPETYSFDFDLLASQPSLVTKFKRHFPSYDAARLHERIKSELLTNLADLALFGESELVDALQRTAPSLPPDELARSLLLLSEVRTYPTLFGLGGTANYDARYVEHLPMLGQDLEWALHSSQSRQLSVGQYESILGGIGLDVETLTVDNVIDFHSSNDAKLLRKAIAAFEHQAHAIASSPRRDHDIDPVLAEALEVERILREVNRELRRPASSRRYDRTMATTSWLLQLGGLALGSWAGAELAGTSFADIGTGAILSQAIITPARRPLANAFVRRRFRPGLANLWRIRRSRKKGPAS